MFDGAIADLVSELGRLPGVGPKSAQRDCVSHLQAEPDDVHRLADAMITVKEKVRFASNAATSAKKSAAACAPTTAATAR